MTMRDIEKKLEQKIEHAEELLEREAKQVGEAIEREAVQIEQAIEHGVERVEEVLEHELERPTVPKAAVLYGDIVYWGTILGSFVTVLGSILAFVTELNYLEPELVLSAIWEGRGVDEVWEQAGGKRPDGHWYVEHLTRGDGLTMTGIALGVFVVVPGMLASTWHLLRERQRLFAGFGLTAAGITVAAMFA